MARRSLPIGVLAIGLLCVTSIVPPPTATEARPELVRKGSFELLPGVTLNVRASPFVASRHRVEHCPAPLSDNICAIDGMPVYGTDEDLPTTQLDAMVLEIDGKSVQLDTSAMFDPWLDRPRKEHFSASVTVEGFQMYKVVGTFSDGAAFYVAEWLVTMRGSVRTLLTNDERVIECTIDPTA